MAAPTWPVFAAAQEELVLGVITSSVLWQEMRRGKGSSECDEPVRTAHSVLHRWERAKENSFFKISSKYGVEEADVF